MKINFLALLLLGIFAFMPREALAEETVFYGRELYCELANIIGGNLGIILGLLVCLGGFGLFVFSGKGGYIVMMMFGASIPFFPGMFENFLSGMDNALSGAQNPNLHSGNGLQGCR